MIINKLNIGLFNQILKNDKLWAYVLKNEADTVLLDIAGNHIEAKTAGDVKKLSGWIHIKLLSSNPPRFEIIPAKDVSFDSDSLAIPLNLSGSKLSVAAELKNWFNPSEKLIAQLIGLLGGKTGSLKENIVLLLKFYEQADSRQKNGIDHLLIPYIKQEITLGNAIIYRFPIVYNNRRGSVFVKAEKKRLDVVLNLDLSKLGKIRLIFSSLTDCLNLTVNVNGKFRHNFINWSKEISSLMSDYPKDVNVSFKEIKLKQKDIQIELWA